jgi:alkylation response protein AidB-like acyl-CoA dehydrogenase
VDFELSPKQQEIKERAAEFADREVAPYAAEWDREARFPAEVFGKLAEAGFVGLRVPGGMGGRDSLSEPCRPLSRVTGRPSPPPRVCARCRRRL